MKLLSTALLLQVLVGAYAGAQTIDAKSNGSDGALFLTTPGVIEFDPQDFHPPLNEAAHNVYHFTFIYIGKDVTVKFSSRKIHAPVFWLAQGSVEILGTIVLDGSDAGPISSLAGPGGYPGGAHGKAGYKPNAT